MSDVLLLEIDLSCHRSIGLFILAVNSQYNDPGEIILENDLHVLKFQQTASLLRVCFSWAPQNPVRMGYALPRCRSG